ncbi:putative hydrolase [Sphingomonas changbaiensis NBRC 104936]|uniref:Putative hydrolase n=1 Tax=Sphingomonas changbaiensis NBRC 104936 TaxID=1219043 RepID=A0A0E9MS97_9SPHN|nr:serine hydrolase domain-containing protein [Sphingomonas changbaiensis]GAO40652.1 putative hydrolase [Sphingomonas changbaiensis NBRC 104936]
MRAFFIPLVLIAAPALATPLTPAQIAEIDRIAVQALKETGVPSASVAVVTDGKLQFAKAYGKQRNDASPPTTTAAYPIASVSKQITAGAILLLAEEGKLSLDDKVSRYLPELTDADKITIRQLLNHTSGYRDFWPQNYAFSAMEKPVKPQEILDRWAKQPLDFPPGSQWQYSNTGFVAAGLIIEKVTGEPLMQFLQTRIFQPLHMKVGDSDYDLKPTDAQPFTRFALGPVRLAKAPAAGWLFAAGQLLTTPTELSKWNIARIDRALLKPASWAEQEREIILTDGKGSGYGLGVTVDQVRGHPRIQHGGAAVGYLADNRVYPADKAAVTVFVNADFGNAHNAIADRIEAMILGQDPDTAAARAIFDQLRQGKADRTKFTADFNAYLTPQVLADHRASLMPLGEPQSFVRLRPARMRGGFTSEVYEVRYPGRKLTISLRAEPNGGKIEEFLIYPEAQ